MGKETAHGTESESAVHVKWRDQVAEHDYAAAEAYLALNLDGPAVGQVIGRLRETEPTTRRASDTRRAAGLSAAAIDDHGVMKDLIKVIRGERLSPVLVVSGKKKADIADGFHRVSLVYRIEPYAEIPLKLA